MTRSRQPAREWAKGKPSTAPRSGRWLAALAAATFVAYVGCSAGELHLLPGSEAVGGAGGAFTPDTGQAGSAGALLAPEPLPELPPPDCVSPECETLECNADPACRNDCRAQHAACALTCASDDECSTKEPFCHPGLGFCTRCTRDEHCLLLYRGARSVCSDGVCLPCAATSECPPGVMCQGGRCGDCVFDEDCAGNQLCVDYRCQ